LKIFIVTEEFNDFPVSLLYNTLKFSFEKQIGIMNQLRQTIDLALDEFDYKSDEKGKLLVSKPIDKRMIFSTTLLHAVLTERS